MVLEDSGQQWANRSPGRSPGAVHPGLLKSRSLLPLFLGAGSIRATDRVASRGLICVLDNSKIAPVRGASILTV